MTSAPPSPAPGDRHKFCRAPLSLSLPPHRRATHTSGVSLNYRKQLATMEGANEFLSSLTEVQRSNLGSALTRVDSERDESGERVRV